MLSKGTAPLDKHKVILHLLTISGLHSNWSRTMLVATQIRQQSAPPIASLSQLHTAAQKLRDKEASSGICLTLNDHNKMMKEGRETVPHCPLLVFFFYCSKTYIKFLTLATFKYIILSGIKCIHTVV